MVRFQIEMNNAREKKREGEPRIPSWTEPAQGIESLPTGSLDTIQLNYSLSVFFRDLSYGSNL